jgi:hypothetical protein
MVVASILHPTYSRLLSTREHAGCMLTGLILAAISAALLVIRTRAHVPRAEAPRCVRCRYDLTGNLSGVCPECGKPIAAVQHKELAARLREVEIDEPVAEDDTFIEAGRVEPRPA